MGLWTTNRLVALFKNKYQTMNNDMSDSKCGTDPRDITVSNIGWCRLAPALLTAHLILHLLAKSLAERYKDRKKKRCVPSDRSPQ